MRFLLSITFLLVTVSAFSQFDRRWEARYYEPGVLDEVAAKVVIHNGNRYVAGTSGGSSGNIFVTKYDANGAILWTYETGAGTPILEFSTAYDMAVSSDGSVAVLGTMTNFQVALLFKLDADGNLLWHINPTNSPNNSKPFTVRFDSQGNIYCAIRFGEDIVVYKYNSAGTVQWSDTRTTTGNIDVVTSSMVDSSDRFIIAGYTTTSVGTDPKIPMLAVYTTGGDIHIDGATALDGVTSPSQVSYPVDIFESDGVLYASWALLQVTKINLTTGAVLGTTTLGNFLSSTSNKRVRLGSDGFYYSVDVDIIDRLVFRKFSADGTLVWTKQHFPTDERQHVEDVYLNKVDNKFYVVSRKETFVAAQNMIKDVYQLHESSPDNSARTIASLSAFREDYKLKSMAFDPSGRITVTGDFANGLFRNDVSTINIAISNGAKLWDNLFLSPNSMEHKAEMIALGSDNSVYVAGIISGNFGTFPNYFSEPQYGIIKYDPGGHEVWRKKRSRANE